MARPNVWIILEQCEPRVIGEQGAMWDILPTDRTIKNRADGQAYLRSKDMRGRFHCVPTRGAFEIVEMPVTKAEVSIAEVE